MPILREDKNSRDRKVELTLVCVKHIKTTWTDVDATAALNRCFNPDNPNTYAELLVSEELLVDLVSNCEAKKIRVYAAELNYMKANKGYKVASRAARVDSYFKAAAPSPKANAKAKAAGVRKLLDNNGKTKDSTARFSSCVIYRKP